MIGSLVLQVHLYVVHLIFVFANICKCIYVSHMMFVLVFANTCMYLQVYLYGIVAHLVRIQKQNIYTIALLNESPVAVSFC